MDAESSSTFFDALAAESLGIDVCDVLMEQLHLRPLNTLKERHPAKFAAEISFLDQTITLKQNPGAATGLKASNGGTVWNCARALTRYLETRSEAVDVGVEAVEIGAGTGLCGIAAAILGARVLLTDKRGMVDLLGDNIAANAEAIERAGGRCAVEALSWGQPGHSLYRTRHAFVLASDVVYHRADAENLLYSMARLCGSSQTCRVLIDAPTDTVSDTEQPDLERFPLHAARATRNDEKITPVLLLAFKQRDEYPCGVFFEKATRIFDVHRIERTLWCGDDQQDTWSTLHVLRLTLRALDAIEHDSLEAAARAGVLPACT